MKTILHSIKYVKKMSTGPSSPTSIITEKMENFPQEMSPHLKIKNFVESIDDILTSDEYDNDLFIKILQITISSGYKFISQEPVPTLATCANILLRDQKKFPENSRMYHYYNAMISLFMRESFKKIGAKSEHIIMMTNKINTSIENFKEN